MPCTMSEKMLPLGVQELVSKVVSSMGHLCTFFATERLVVVLKGFLLLL